MKKRCTKLMPFDENKMEPGMLVFIGTEHIGMVADPKYFKNDTDPINIIYEATPAFLNCFQRTALSERQNTSRPWDTMGYADYIEYPEKTTEAVEDDKDTDEILELLESAKSDLEKAIGMVNES